MEDEQLIKQVLSGQQAAFHQLVLKYQNFVFTITHRVLSSREEAEEAAQDTFLKVYKTLSSFEGKSKFSTWLYSIAYRTAIDLARKKKLPIDSIDNDDHYLQIKDSAKARPDDILQQQDLQTTLQMVIERLKPIDATLITLFYLHEKSIKEIVEITGLSKSNVKTKLHRLRETMRTELADLLQNEAEDLL
ncbi:MAG: sigma-70 family RNA polymerase sigma factor [Saprospiraceae bacterium]|nr:sigma-70 family RNA polymerase sigma factor [Saprospiraceae bacterium]